MSLTHELAGLPVHLHGLLELRAVGELGRINQCCPDRGLDAVDLLGELEEGRGGASGVMHEGFDLHGSHPGAAVGVHPGDQFYQRLWGLTQAHHGVPHQSRDDPVAAESN